MKLPMLLMWMSVFCFYSKETIPYGYIGVFSSCLIAIIIYLNKPKLSKVETPQQRVERINHIINNKTLVAPERNEL